MKQCIPPILVLVALPGPSIGRPLLVLPAADCRLPIENRNDSFLRYQSLPQGGINRKSAMLTTRAADRSDRFLQPPDGTGVPSVSATATIAMPRDQKEAALSEEEEDKLREEQDPGRRIGLYLDFAEDRLNQFDQFRQKPADPKYDTGGYLDKLLGQYIALEDELKNWIQYQYDHQGDIRKGLRALLDRGPRQLEQLRHIQQDPDPFASDYRNSLRDAIDSLTDALDGATNALSSQEKKFGELKKQEKLDEQQARQAAKEEKKRIKEEEKLRKKERKQKQVPEDVDQND